MSTLDPTYLEHVQSYEIFEKSGFGEVMTLFYDNPTISEECQLCIHVDRVKNMFCDIYIFEDEFAIIPHVKHDIVAIAPILDSSFDESMIAMMLI